MYFIDTHAHIYLQDFSNDIHAVLNRAKENGVMKIITPSIDKSSFDAMTNLQNQYKEVIYSLIGVHPSSIEEKYKEELDFVEKELKSNNYIGIGEIGIDLYWDKTYIKEQKIAFETQLQLAKEYSLPIVIHQRESFEEITDILFQSEFKGLKGIFHCFSGNYQLAKKCYDNGFFIGIGGVVTYKNSLMKEVVEKMPVESLVFETDSPYLTPVPSRGKRNEPCNISVIANEVSLIKSLDIEALKNQVYNNVISLFNF